MMASLASDTLAVLMEELRLLREIADVACKEIEMDEEDWPSSTEMHEAVRRYEAAMAKR